jgi:xylan 1,4-beta-xylosidase
MIKNFDTYRYDYFNFSFAPLRLCSEMKKFDIATIVRIILLQAVLVCGNILPVPGQSPGPTEARLLIGGNYPDPTLLEHEGIYYMTHSSFNFRPGLLIWQSSDFNEWTPVTYALNHFTGNVWAPDLVEHDGRFYIYFPSVVNGQFENYVVTAERIKGPWSDALPLGVGHIDPGHVVGSDGKRYLHLSGGHVVKLSDDGLRAVGEPEKVMEGWPIPEDWAIECFCLESPKLFRQLDWYYLTAAQGGTFGPSTSHMITSFRSKTPVGPWESSPYNPVIHTWSRSEKWWSKGHGTLVKGPRGQWFMVFHGIPNGFRTLGRSTLAEPVEWDNDAWYYVPEKWPSGWEKNIEINMPLSDEFFGDKLNIHWQFYKEYDENRIRFNEGKLEMKGAGDHPGNSYPLTFIPRDSAYEIETKIEISGNARGGIMFFVSEDEYLGLSVNANGAVKREQQNFKRYRNTDEPETGTNRVGFKIVNNCQDVRFYYKTEGKDWKQMQPGMEVSQNGIIRPALFVHGNGNAKFDYMRYRILKDEF